MDEYEIEYFDRSFNDTYIEIVEEGDDDDENYDDDY